MPTDRQRILGHQAAVAQVRERLTRFAQTAWLGMGGHRDADVDRLVTRLVPQVRAGQVQAARLTDAYLAALLGIRSAAVDGAMVSGTAVRTGVDLEDEYRRPAVTVYSELATGATYDNAKRAGLQRLLSLIEADIQLAMRAQEQVALARGRSRYYRRVLTGSESCTMCAIASTQRYRVGTLKPIHPGCDCTVAPIEGSTDPGQVINAELLEQVHESIEDELGGTDRGARDLGQSKSDSQGRPLSDFTDLIVVREHGEMGPVLTWRKHAFTSKADLPN